MASIVFTYKCITGSATVNQCMGFNHISLVMEGICNNEIFFIPFILINSSKTGQTKFMKRTCQSNVCAVVSILDMLCSVNLEEGGAICTASVLTTTGAVCTVETLNWKGAT
jgi:hypothetical protein